jgi:hypothetical protein
MNWIDTRSKKHGKPICNPAGDFWYIGYYEWIRSMNHPGSHPSTQGEWQPLEFSFEHLPVHVALLHTGKVLAFGGSGNDPEHLNHPFPAEIWDPVTGERKSLDQPLAGDLFCAGHTFLADGRLLVAGGTFRYDKLLAGMTILPFSGLEQTYLFDPVSERWARGDDMAVGRWYPSLVQLGDDRVLAMAGFTKRFPWAFLRTIEVYTPATGWRTLEGAQRWLPLYPRLHLLPNGNVFYAGSYNTHYTFPFSVRGFPTAILDTASGRWRTIGPPNRSQREEGASVLLPLTPEMYRAKVLLVGGGSPRGRFAEAEAEVIDLDEQNPRWKPVQPMQHARYHAYAVLLPDQKVLVVGGRSGEKEHHHPPDTGPSGTQLAEGSHPTHDPRAVLDAEIFDPGSERWTTGAAMMVDRLYHSSALLLPDGRVMTAGSNPARKINDLRIELYHPPYLFQGPRPEVEAAPGRASYGAAFTVKSPHARHIEKIVLVRPMSTTHCLSTEQRLVELPILSRSDTNLSVNIPANPNLIPPGYSMLFALAGGVPSVAKFINLG